MKTKIITSIAGIVALSSLILALPVAAETSAKTQAKDSGSMSAQNKAENMQKNMGTVQERASNAIDQRIASLTKLIARIQEMKKITDPQKASINALVQGEISTLTALKAQIAADTSTSTLRTDAQSITKAYRIYALIMPQLSILAAADRIGTIADGMAVVSGKLQTRLSQGSSTPALQAGLSDMNTKIADAVSQAQTAVNEVAALSPDNGDKTLMASNNTTLKDARSKIQAATKDLQAARKDAQTITQALKTGEKNDENRSKDNKTKDASSTDNH